MPVTLVNSNAMGFFDADILKIIATDTLGHPGLL